MNMTHALVAAAGLAAMFAATAAEAQPRRQEMIIRVKPRSYLDAGNVVPKGSLSRYAEDVTFFTPPAINHIGSPYGEDQLPPRIGGGRNPFGPISLY